MGPTASSNASPFGHDIDDGTKVQRCVDPIFLAPCREQGTLPPARLGAT